MKAGFGHLLASFGHTPSRYYAPAVLHTRACTEQRLRATVETDFQNYLVLRLAS